MKIERKYIVPVAILLILAFGLLILPKSLYDRDTTPDKMVYDINDPSRFLSPDFITDRIIKKDPSLLLLDVRSTADNSLFAIPDAIHIPIDSLLVPFTVSLLKAGEFDKVFYSNSDVLADQAWMVAHRIGAKNIFVMKGGINQWFNDIVRSETPPETAPVEAFETYSFRKAANQYFFGIPANPVAVAAGVAASAPTAASKPAAPKKKVVVPVKVEVPESSGGGC